MRKPCPFHNSYICGCYNSVNIPDKECSDIGGCSCFVD